MLAEALGLLWIAWARFDLGTHDGALYTFSFLTLLYFAAFSIVSARERRRFWNTTPSKALAAALAADVLIGTALTLVGLPGLMPLPWWQMLTIFAFAMVACLGVNDAIKVALIQGWVPTAAPSEV
jgi:O-antigen/teichoic acid export membrane protein